jgi:hypothetical protein
MQTAFPKKSEEIESEYTGNLIFKDNELLVKGQVIFSISVSLSGVCAGARSSSCSSSGVSICTFVL